MQDWAERELRSEDAVWFSGHPVNPVNPVRQGFSGPGPAGFAVVDGEKDRMNRINRMTGPDGHHRTGVQDWAERVLHSEDAVSFSCHPVNPVNPVRRVLSRPVSAGFAVVGGEGDRMNRIYRMTGPDGRHRTGVQHEAERDWLSEAAVSFSCHPVNPVNPVRRVFSRPVSAGSCRRGLGRGTG